MTARAKVFVIDAGTGAATAREVLDRAASRSAKGVVKLQPDEYVELASTLQRISNEAAEVLAEAA